MKTNFIKSLKQFLFLFIAVLETASIYAQTNPNSTNLDIGGKSSDSGILHIDYGGSGSQGAPRDKGTGITAVSFESTTNCIFAFPGDIGGNTSSGHGDKGTTGQSGDFDPYDIGGRNSGGRGTSTGGEFANLIDTGGRGSSGTGTGQFDDDDTDPYDIGGKSTTGGLGNNTLVNNIGGSKTPDLGNGCDIGGRGSVGTGYIENEPFSEMTLFASMEYFPGFGCDIETGGRTGQGTSTSGDDDGDDDQYDTGGRGSRGNVGEQFTTFSWHCPDFY